MTSTQRGCSHPGCGNLAVVGITTFLSTTPRCWCAKHVLEAVEYLETFRRGLEALALRTTSQGPETTTTDSRARRSTTPERLAKVADAYRAGGAQAVMARLGIGRSQAFRLIGLARMAKLLDDER